MKKAVNTRTQKQWDKVTEILDYKWRNNWWNEDKEDTCISLEYSERGSINTYMDCGYKIISFKEFMKEYAPSPRNKEYKLIITPTNKTIIINTETGKKGIARLHPDDKYDFLEGVKVAMDKLNGVEPKKIRTIGELPVGTKIKILNETHGWGHIKEGDIGTLITTNTKTWNGEKDVVIKFNENKNWILNSDVKEGEYFEVIEEDKKSILSEPEFKKCKVTEFYLNQWTNEWCDKINEKYNINTGFNNSIGNDTIIGDVVGKGDIDDCDFYVVNYNNHSYVLCCDDVEKYEPKLYDSFGEELKEGDDIVNFDIETGNSLKEKVVIKDGVLCNNGLRLAHRADKNNGKYDENFSMYKWKVIKIKR